MRVMRIVKRYENTLKCAFESLKNANRRISRNTTKKIVVEVSDYL